MSNLANKLAVPLASKLAVAICQAIGSFGFSPASLFSGSEQGAFYDDKAISSLFQDTAAATPVTASGQPIGRVNDLSGRGNNLTQATAGDRPLYDVTTTLASDVSDGTSDFWTSAGGGGSTTAFCFMTVVKPTQVGVRQTLYSDAGTNTGYKVEFNASNQLVLSAGNGTTYTAVTTANSFTNGQVVTVIAYDDGINLYAMLDGGVLVSAVRPTVSAGTAGFTLNKDNGAASGYFKGNTYGRVLGKNTAWDVDKRIQTMQWLVARAGVLVPAPANFDWSPSVSVYQNGTQYFTNYIPLPFLVEGAAGVTTFYVDGDTGNDANPGTAASPKKSLTPISAGRIGKLLIYARGTFYVGLTSNIQKGHDNLCVVAWGGAACNLTMLADQTGVAPIVWTLHSGTTWVMTAPFASFNSIQCFTGTDWVTMTEVPTVADLATCVATPNSRFSTGATHYFNTASGLIPTNGSTVLANGGSAQQYQAATNAYNQRMQFIGITFLGGDTSMNVAGVSTFSKRAEFAHCRFMRAGNNGAMHNTGNTPVINYRCTAGPSKFDGFAYTTLSGSADGTAVPPAIEINCTSTKNGYVSSGANQGSTTHFGGKVLRVSGTYFENADDQIADVGAASRSWNLGCTFGPKGIGSGKSGAQCGNNASDVRMFFDGCTFTGLDWGWGANNAQATILYKNMTAPSTNPASTGVITTY